MLYYTRIYVIINIEMSKCSYERGFTMNSDLFEPEFGEYLERDLHDRTETTLFELMRDAYRAGWESACRRMDLIRDFPPEKI